MSLTCILASHSPARLAVLRGAGITPRIVVSGVDEDAIVRNAEHVNALDPDDAAEATVCLLATEKARASLAKARGELEETRGRALIIGCDSMLLRDGSLEGKPHSPEVARRRWLDMRGTTARLVTGHALIFYDASADPVVRETCACASTLIHFASPSEAEIDAYIATGEPLEVAGACTLDGYGGPFVSGIEGDYHNVIGLSLPLVRSLAAEMGIFWPDLWDARQDCSTSTNLG